MGDNPDTNVVNRWGFAHEAPNLGVIGASVGAPGASMAQQHLRSILAFCNSPLMNAVEAYIQYQRDGGSTAEVYPSDLTPHFNYVTHDNTRAVDDSGQMNCGTAYYDNCLVLHNGGVLVMDDSEPMNAGRAWTFFLYDPDGKYSGTTDPGLWFVLHRSGRLTTWGVHMNNPALDPAWFNWGN